VKRDVRIRCAASTTLLAVMALIAYWIITAPPVTDAPPENIIGEITRSMESVPGQGVGIGLSVQGPASVRRTERAAGEYAEFKDALAQAADRAHRRQAFRDAVARESLAESIDALFREPASDLFSRAVTTQSSDTTDAVSRAQRALLDQPRVMKIVAAAANGSDETRAYILQRVIKQLERYLARPRATQGGAAATLNEPELNLGEAFPLILFEADRSGDSLSILLRWYAAAPAPIRDQIASATKGILRRVVDPDAWGKVLGQPTDEQAPIYVPSAEDARQAPLTNYALPPAVSSDERDRIMNFAATYIQAPWPKP